MENFDKVVLIIATVALVIDIILVAWATGFRW